MSKKIFLILIAIFGAYALGIFVYYSASPPSQEYCPIRLSDHISFEDKSFPGHIFKAINDASCLNITRVYDIISVTTVEDIRKALSDAHEKNLHISLAGKRHSMGGQAFYKDALVLDMTKFNKIISLDEAHNIITVQSGATWHDIQLFLNPKNLAVKAMQSTDIFTVGGSLSVNAHGMDHTVGSMAPTIKSFTLMLADGSIKQVTPDHPLFNIVIGGYGLFGVILEIAFEVRDNVMYALDLTAMPFTAFPEFFKTHQQEYELLYAHLSTSPFSFFKELIVYGYRKVDSFTGPFPELHKVSLITVRRFLLNLSKIRFYAQIVKWVAEKYIDPYLIQPLNSDTLISRNQVMHDSVEYLENIISDETDILHEYFIPQEHFVPYIRKVAELLKKRKAVVLNASVRVIKKELIMLNYAPQDMFALVLYINQKVTPQALEEMKELTRALINLTLSFKGTFFLPYQLYFTKKQLKRAYPSINTFFDLKRKYDPTLFFMNEFYAKYS